MSDHVFVVRCIAAPWTDWQARWVLDHRGVYEYTGDDQILTFATLREVQQWVEQYRPGWWLELPPGVILGR